MGNFGNSDSDSESMRLLLFHQLLYSSHTRVLVCVTNFTHSCAPTPPTNSSSDIKMDQLLKPTYYERNREKMKENARKYYSNHRRKITEYNHRYYLEKVKPNRHNFKGENQPSGLRDIISPILTPAIDDPTVRAVIHHGKYIVSFE